MGTLLFIAEELDRRLRGQKTDLGVIASAAVKHLDDKEAITTALAGLQAWKSTSIRACNLGALASELRRTLSGALEASVAQFILARWDTYDYATLRERWEGAKERELQRRAEWEAHLADQGRPAEPSAEFLAAQKAAQQRIKKRPPLVHPGPNPESKYRDA